jgi:hypothetical protein
VRAKNEEVATEAGLKLLRELNGNSALVCIL